MNLNYDLYYKWLMYVLYGWIVWYTIYVGASSLITFCISYNSKITCVN